MLKHSKTLASLCASLMLCSCAHPSQNNYGEGDVGHTMAIGYGRVKLVRVVDITGHNSGTGAAVGILAGGVAGSTVGRGGGSLLGLVGGALVGGIVGAASEQALKDRQGLEYTIKFTTGATLAVVQNIAKTDQPISRGQCVMVQFGPHYQRVLPDEDENDCIPAKSRHQ